MTNPQILKMDGKSDEDADAPKAASFHPTPAFLTMVQSLRGYVEGTRMKSLAIEGEPAAWLPEGIDCRLRFTECEVVISPTHFWFRARSGSLLKEFATEPVCIDSALQALEAEAA